MHVLWGNHNGITGKQHAVMMELSGLAVMFDYRTKGDAKTKSHSLRVLLIPLFEHTTEQDGKITLQMSHLIVQVM